MEQQENYRAYIKAANKALKNILREDAKDEKFVSIVRSAYDELAGQKIEETLWAYDIAERQEEAQLYFPVKFPDRKFGPKNLLLFSHDFTNTGAPIALLNLATVLMDLGYFLCVVSSSRDLLFDDFRRAGIAVIIMPEIRKLEGSEVTVRLLDEFLGEFDGAVVNTMVMYPVIRRINKIEIPTLWWIHEADAYWGDENLKKELPSELSDWIRVYCVGEYSQASMRKNGIPYPTQILHLGQKEIKIESDEQKDTEKIVFIVPAVICERKGQDILAKAVKKMPWDIRQQCEFWLVGLESDKEILYLIEDVNSEIPVIRRFGPVTHERCLELSKKADFYLIPSRDDTLPLSAIECMMLSKVCLCSDATGVSMLMQDGRDGIVFASENEEALCDTLCYVVENSEQIKQLEPASYDLFKKHFSDEAFRENIAAILYQMIGENQGCRKTVSLEHKSDDSIDIKLREVLIEEFTQKEELKKQLKEVMDKKEYLEGVLGFKDEYEEWSKQQIQNMQDIIDSKTEEAEQLRQELQLTAMQRGKCMRKVKKLKKLMILCIKKPKIFFKGIKCFFKYGWTGAREQIRILANQPLAEEKKKQIITNGEIRFSVIMPVYNVELKWIKKAVESVKQQTYTNWQLCIVDDCSSDDRLKQYLDHIQGEKIKVKFLSNNSGISEASNAAASMADGEYLLLLDNDDVLSVDAMYELYMALKNEKADVLYSDMDIIDEKDVHSAPLYKPDWSPDLFLSQMYLGHLICIRKEIFEEVGGFRSEFNGSQDYDLLLRITEHTDKIKHISKILYSWRSLPTSTAANAEAKPYAQTAGLRAVQEHLDRVLGEGKAQVRETENLFVYDVRYCLESQPLVSILIPTKDHCEDLRAAVNSILEKTVYENYEIIILDNNSSEKETLDYFEELSRLSNVKVIKANYEFNWSKINNHGIRYAKGEVIVCLNNDVVVIEPEWLSRLAEKALQKHIGTVGGLLLYPDGTIQHAGIVVGMGGWADHVYKGMKPVHCGSPYISCMVTRNVSASTGACLAFRKELVGEEGAFDEKFVICGSDVELSLRLAQRGYYNVYDPGVLLYHHESKSRDSYIPEIDFVLSDQMYRVYRMKGDPYYNVNLDYSKCIPVPADHPQFQEETAMEVAIAEIQPMKFRVIDYPRKRINLIVPSINTEHVFGGISTALKFFEALAEELKYDVRIILSDAEPDKEAIDSYSKQFRFVSGNENSQNRKQIVPFSNRSNLTLPVSEKDYFVFTGWWTAYCIQTEYRNLAAEGRLFPNPFIYFIQDYEPGFYPWSSRYLLADSTYRSEFQQIAVFNSHELKEYFNKNGYQFNMELEFPPLLNKVLRERVAELGSSIDKKRQILVYGRPGTARNAFELAVYALRSWVEISSEAEKWEVYSAGEVHAPVDLGKGKKMYSLGKLTLDEYASVLEESYAGISLMVSPHPSYPPLEMAVFEVNVITNMYGNKDLSSFNPHITSLADVSPLNIARHLDDICRGYQPTVSHEIRNKEYCSGETPFKFVNVIAEYLEKQ